MKVLVLNPPSFDHFQYIKEGRCESKKGGQLTPPVTLGIISALLTKHNIENDLFDLMAKPVKREMLEKILSKGYNLVFINVSAQTYDSDKKIAELIRKLNKTAVICVLGVLPTALPKKILEIFDIAIIGEPEYTCLELAKGMPYKDIKGIVYKSGKRIKINSKRGLIQNLDELPFPNRKNIPSRYYINPKSGEPFTAIKIERGCPFDCSYCTASFYYGKKPRYRSVENVILEIKYCVNELGIKDFLFLSDTFTINQRFVVDLCKELIKEKINIKWSCNSRVDTFNAEMAGLMKKAGCWLVGFGVESGSEKIISMISKKIKPEQAINSAEICRSVGIRSIMYYMLGFPNETKKQMHETIDLSHKIKSDMARFFVVTPLPGSRLYKSYPLLEKDFNQLNLSDINVNLSGVSNKDMKRMIFWAYFSFYIRPRQFFRVLSLFDMSLSRFFNLIRNNINLYFFK